MAVSAADADSGVSADYVRGMSRQKVLVIGRHQFDLTNGREGQPPASDHVVGAGAVGGHALSLGPIGSA